MVYFDNAATSWPKPQKVIQATNEAFSSYGANPGRSGHSMSINTAVKVFEARESIASFFGAARAEDVIFTPNCTHAVNIAIKGILNRGDHVILSDLEHNATLRPIHTLAERGEIAYSIAEIHPDNEMTVNAYQRLITANTKLIICTHGSNVWGMRTPIEKIGELAKKNGTYFLVDAAQTAGIVTIDVQKANIDFLCTAGHKSLYGPTGTGLLITPHGNQLNTIVEGGTGTLSMEYSQPQGMPERLESGTANTLGILGLGAGIKFLREAGIDNIYRHEIQIAGEIFQRLSDIPNVKLYNRNFEVGENLPVISFNVEGVSSEKLTQTLSEKGFALRGGLHCAPLAHKKMGTLKTGTARISIGVFNKMREARSLCNEIAAIAHI